MNIVVHPYEYKNKLVNKLDKKIKQEDQVGNMDSGTTGMYFATKDANILRNTEVSTGIKVRQPDGTYIVATHKGILDIPHVGPTPAYIFKSLVGSLISISELVDLGLVVVYRKENVIVYKGKKEILKGNRDKNTGLWMVDLQCFQQKDQLTCASAVRLRTQEEKVAFWHGTFGSPAISTISKALDKKYINIPGITGAMMRKFAPNPTATAFGHLDQTRQGMRSTKPQSQLDEEDLSTQANDTTKEGKNRKNVYITFQPTGRNFMDETGKFPQQSKSGALYVLIMYCYDTNYIHMEPVNSRSGSDMADAFERGMKLFKDGDCMPIIERLDNECSDLLRKAIKKYDITIELAPPGQHRTNLAERAIRTAKNHIISVICTTDKQFPLELWDELIPQGEITLNLMRGSRDNPDISAYEAVRGPYDLSKHPMAPAGMKVVVHEKPLQRGSWDPHGVEGYYLGPAMEHYRCYRTWISHTNAHRISDTVSWHPAKLRMPFVNLVDELKQLGKDVNEVLDNITQLQPEVITKLKMAILENIKSTSDNVQKSEDTKVDDKIQNQIDLAVDEEPSAHNDEAIQRVHSQILHDDALKERVLAPVEENIQPIEAIKVSILKKKKSSREKKKRSNKDIRKVRTSSRRKSIVDIAKQEARPKRATQSRKFDDGTNMILPKAKQRGHTRTIAMMNELKISKKHAKFITKAVKYIKKNVHQANSAIDLNADGTILTSNSALRGPDAELWEAAHAEEIERLLSSGTGKFIQANELPKGRKAAYCNPQCKIKIKNGLTVRRVRCTIGGDQLPYPGATAAFTAKLEVIRIQLNAAVSENEDIMTLDIKDFYLGTPLERPEYMRISEKHLTKRIIEKYKLQGMIHNGHVLMEITKGIYGLKQAGKLSQDRLIAHLAQYGYVECKHTPCLFRHNTNGISFTLVVDDFLVRYKTQESVDHLQDILKKLYVITTETGNQLKYVGITLEYHRSDDRKVRHLTMSMPGYVEKAMIRFKRLQLQGADSPLVYIPPVYGKRTQDVYPDPPSVPLTPEELLELQEIVGVFLFYARAVDPTMLTPLSKLASKQAEPTSLIKPDLERFLQYASRYPNAGLIIRPSNMILLAHCDASYLSESEGRSRAGGILWFGDHEEDTVPNAAVSYISVIIPAVASSTAESEYASAFITGQEGTSIMHTLIDLGYNQHMIDITSDNACAVGIANKTVKQKRSRGIDMRYHWIRDQVSQKKISIRWKPGIENLADFFTKAHPVHHHKSWRNRYVHDLPRLAQKGVLMLET